ncbi:RIP metalloprotease RseP [Roseicitreum antarcticum]|uniref:Zinc metalloprotease n=1 Tax=Roseicitreum antarcticum TaxID=564137 RepID=A0A1H2VUA8_9RHOB|nr:RIP metalloprotease RseP [Roseicitreum antarcticum]SDW71960.1 site-2 protease. Metallo peptidase. MEROPS family M50B [Roseicitreum antarcticum]
MDIVGLIPSFGNVFFTIAMFVIAILVIVTVHEFGHYIVGRWSGIHAEVFSIGFGPVLAARVDRHGTKWQLAALPFGGYVKFLGDADAASGKDVAALSALDAKRRRASMHGAPLWARALTVAAGPVFNFIFAVLVFATFMMWRGVAVDTPVVGQITPLPNVVNELQMGDLITAVDGRETSDLEAFYNTIEDVPPAPVVTYDVMRDGQALQVQGPYPQPPLAGSISLQSAARDAGMQPGDVIVSVDGTPLSAFSELRDMVAASGGSTLDLEVWRDGTVLDLALTPRSTDLPMAGGGFETRWLIGLTSGSIFEHPTRMPGVVEASQAAVSQTWEIMRTSLEGLYYMVTGMISTCNISGPIGIAETSAAMASDGVADFIWFLAVLSVAVGLMNLFPIPVLDGGHLVFHAWEAVTGKPPSDGAMRIFMTVGLTILISVMLFAITNDLFCP